MASGKGLTDEENDRLRTAIRELLETVGVDQSKLAPSLGVTQPTLSAFLGGRQGSSFRVAIAAATMLKRDPSTILDLPSGATQVVVPAHLADDDETQRTIRYAVDVLGVSAEAVSRVTKRLQRGGERPPPLMLLHQLDAEEQTIKFDAKVGMEEARRLRAEVDVGDALDAPPDMAAIRARAKKKREKKKFEGDGE